jgi:peptidoglycan/xylan/chitin deacetylase (PgdA/CDA1 family)
LTFDTEHPDGPRCLPGNEERILAVLRAAKIPATFFLQGRWARAYPETARRIVTEGHQVGNHSHAHANLSLLTEQGLRTDLREAEEAIVEAAGVDPRPWYRCPYGSHSHTPRLAAILQEAGYRDVHWSVAAEDWAADATAQDLAERVVDEVLSYGDGAIALLHSWPEPVPTAVTRIVEQLRALDAEFVTIGALAAELPGSRLPTLPGILSGGREGFESPSARDIPH